MVESFPADARIDIFERSYLSTIPTAMFSPAQIGKQGYFLMAGPGSKTIRCSRDPAANALFD